MAEEYSNINNEGLVYTNVQDFERWISSRKAGAMSNDRPNKFEVDPEIIRESLMFAETEVDSYLRTGGYSVPVSGDSRTMFEIKKYCYNIAKYYLFGRRATTKESYFEYKNTLSILGQISKGDIKISATKNNSSNKMKFGSKGRSVFTEAEEEGFSV